MVVIQDKSNETTCISPYMTLYSLLNHNIHLCVMNETSSLYDHLISVINQT